jgi:hypothetical protein
MWAYCMPPSPALVRCRAAALSSSSMWPRKPEKDPPPPPPPPPAARACWARRPHAAARWTGSRRWSWCALCPPLPRLGTPSVSLCGLTCRRRLQVAASHDGVALFPRSAQQSPAAAINAAARGASATHLLFLSHAVVLGGCAAPLTRPASPSGRREEGGPGAGLAEGAGGAADGHGARGGAGRGGLEAFVAQMIAPLGKGLPAGSVVGEPQQPPPPRPGLPVGVSAPLRLSTGAGGDHGIARNEK